MLLEIGGRPEIHESAFIAPNATVIGNVKIAASASVWFGAVVRGDINSISIGERSNIQDMCVVHVPSTANAVVGRDVTVGHGAILHGCRVGDNCLIGMGAVVMDNAEIGEDSIVGAGALVTQGAKIPPRSLVLGSPAKVIRELRPEEIAGISRSAEEYHGYAKKYL
jgi:carbonic anhydrase/acetyltransferase-like protein (isoleucine patch superfamily)